MRGLRLAAASLPVVAAMTFVGGASSVGPALSGCGQASSAHHAALVVEHGDGAVTKLCVAFSGAQVTGEQILDLSGVPYKTVSYGSYGKAVCQIQREPASYPPSCWTASSPYWAIFVSRGGGAWTSSSRGISTQTFGEGDAEGFRYEGQSDNTSPAPPNGVCPPPVRATPTPVPASAAAASARPGTSGVAAPRATSAPAGGPTSAATNRAATSAPTSGKSRSGGSAPPVVGQVRVGAPPPASPGSPSTAVWVASALGATLLALLVVQLARPRRTRVQP
jgi:hypothetical protein